MDVFQRPPSRQRLPRVLLLVGVFFDELRTPVVTVVDVVVGQRRKSGRRRSPSAVAHRKRGLERAPVGVQSPRDSVVVVVDVCATSGQRRVDLCAVEVDTGDRLRLLARRAAAYWLR